MSGRRSWGEFDDSGAYFRSLKKSISSGYSFIPRSIKEEDRDRVQGGGRNFKRTLTSLQLVCLGIGTQSSVRLLSKAFTFPCSSSAISLFPRHFRSTSNGKRHRAQAATEST